jgi:hypothetical protein
LGCRGEVDLEAEPEAQAVHPAPTPCVTGAPPVRSMQMELVKIIGAPPSRLVGLTAM